MSDVRVALNWLGAVNGNASDIKQRVALKILGRSTVERQLAFATERGWRHLDFVQTVGDDYANDLGLINADGSENPALVVFKRDGDKVRLFWASEMKKWPIRVKTRAMRPISPPCGRYSTSRQVDAGPNGIRSWLIETRISRDQRLMTGRL